MIPGAEREQNTAICSFLGQHEVSDANLYSHLRTALISIVEEHEAVEFLLVRQYADFFCFCLKAVLEAKSHFPNKITVTLAFERESQKNDFLLQVPDSIPLCAIDRLWVADTPIMKGKNNHVTELRNLQRRVVERSTHVIYYFYEKLYDFPKSLFTFANKIPDLKMIDVSDQEVTQAIELSLNTQFEERAQTVMQKLEEGWTTKKIGAMLGISGERVCQIASKVGHRLRKAIKKGNQMIYACAEPDKHLSCAFFSLDDASGEKLRAFQTVLSWLTRQCYVQVFVAHAEHCHSGFVDMLPSDGVWRHCRLFAAAADSGEPVMTEAHPPLYWAKETKTTIVSGTDDLKMIANMVRRADFCVCDLSTSPYAEEIKKYIADSERASLLDIGRNPFCGE